MLSKKAANVIKLARLGKLVMRAIKLIITFLFGHAFV